MDKKTQQRCLFCDQPDGSKEHIWPTWLQDSLGIASPIRLRIKDARRKGAQANLGLTTTRVCDPCNTGWMSRLENEIKPLLGPMMQGVAVQLDADHQKKLAAWVTKTAMVLEGLRTSPDYFYSQDQRESLRKSSSLPPHTVIWFGHYDGYGKNTIGTDVGLKIDVADGTAGNGPKHYPGLVTTFLFGRLVIQILSAKLGAKVGKAWSVVGRPGPWTVALNQVFPAQGTIFWPTDFSLATPATYAALVRRWVVP